MSIAVHPNRAKILDVRETRACPTPFEYRENRSGKIVIEGYAATWEPYDILGGPDRGGWTERIDQRAFDVTLATKPDLMLLVNHEGWPLARTTTEKLQVTRDMKGLKIRAQLDPDDRDVQRLIPKLRPQANGRAIMDQMSFGFRVKDQVWDASYTQRMITEITLQHGDVSIVNYGANPTTQVAIADALEAASHLSDGQLVELRHLDASLADALEACRADKDPKKPYGDVAYADPRNGKYPIDTEAHARADPIPFSAPAPGVVRGEPPNEDDEEIEPAGTEAWPGEDPITVGVIEAALQKVRDAADPSGLRSITARLAELAAARVSYPPTLAP